MDLTHIIPLVQVRGKRRDDTKRLLRAMLADANSLAARVIADLDNLNARYRIGHRVHPYGFDGQLIVYHIRTDDEGAVLLRLLGHGIDKCEDK